MRSLPLFGIIAGLMLLLAGCDTSNRVVQCPAAVVLSDTSSLTQMRPGAPADLSGELFTALVTGVKSDCTFDKQNGETLSSLDVVFRATRAPTADAVSYSLPYYVAVTQGDRLIGKKIFTVRLDFAPGASTTMVTETVDQTSIHLENGHPPLDYQLVAGFQLTTEQRTYNEKMSRYIP